MERAVAKPVDQLLTKGGYKSVGGVAMQIYVAERVVVRYISDFVYDVAEEMRLYHANDRQPQHHT